MFECWRGGWLVSDCLFFLVLRCFIWFYDILCCFAMKLRPPWTCHQRLPESLPFRLGSQIIQVDRLIDQAWKGKMRRITACSGRWGNWFKSLAAEITCRAMLRDIFPIDHCFPLVKFGYASPIILSQFDAFAGINFHCCYFFTLGLSRKLSSNTCVTLNPQTTRQKATSNGASGGISKMPSWMMVAGAPGGLLRRITWRRKGHTSHFHARRI